MRNIWLAAALVTLLCPAAARSDSLPGVVRRLIQEYWEKKDTSLLPQFAQTDNVGFYIFDRFVEEQMPQRIPVNALRRDLHVSSASPTSASTSIVARSGATDLVSAALESGAIMRKADDKSATFSLNALPIYQIMGGRKPLGCGTLEEDCRQGTGRWIRGLSGSVSINTSGETTPVPASVSSLLGNASGLAVFLTGGNKLQAISARYEFFVKERDNKAAQKALDDAAKALTDKLSSFMANQSEFETRLETVLGEPGKPGWRQDTLNALRRANSMDDMADVLLRRYRLAFDMVAGSPELQASHAAAAQEKLTYITAQNKLLAEKLYRKAFSLDYVHSRPSDQPWLHEVRFIIATPIGKKPPETRPSNSPGKSLTDSPAAAVPGGNFTFNGGLSWYHNLAAGQSGRVRSAQGSLALDWSPAGWGAVRPTYTVAYYFQYMIKNGVLEFNKDAVTPGGSSIPISAPAVEILNTKGPIHVGQLRVNIPLGTSGVSFPAAISYASRTELITGKSFLQGHLGITYDLGRLKTFLQSTKMP